MTQFPICKRIRQLYCRICGQRAVGNGPRWFSVLNFRVVLRRLHDADVEGESAEMYPRGVCKNCAEKYKFDRREGSLYARDPVQQKTALLEPLLEQITRGFSFNEN